jgi:hypothetical protein
VARIHLAYSRACQPTALDPACGPLRLLVSFAYKGDFLNGLKAGIKVGDWVLDSGAYSFKHSGTQITVDDFCRGIDEMSKCAAGPPREVYALDVIGDWRSTSKNVQTMWARGYKAIPTFHIGEPFEVLKVYAENYPKVAIGGVARVRKGAGLYEFLDRCFEVAWPKALHGFAAVRPAVLDRYPFDSVDSTTWCRTPNRYGYWPGVGDLRIRDAQQSLVWTSRYYQRLERDSESRFARDLAKVRVT